MRQRGVARAQPAAGSAVAAGERRQARDGARRVPAVAAFVDRAAAQHYHRRLSGGIGAGEGGDPLGRDAGLSGRPFGGELGDMPGEFVEAQGVRGDELGVVEPFADDHLHHGEGQRRVRAGADQHDFVRLGRGFGLADVDYHDPGAALFRRQHMPRGVGLARQVGAPQHDQLRIRPHVLLGVDLQGAGEAETEPAEAPADHRRAPILAP
jgi:hypothetical protein